MVTLRSFSVTIREKVAVGLGSHGSRFAKGQLDWGISFKARIQFSKNSVCSNRVLAETTMSSAIWQTEQRQCSLLRLKQRLLNSRNPLLCCLPEAHQRHKAFAKQSRSTNAFHTLDKAKAKLSWKGTSSLDSKFRLPSKHKGVIADLHRRDAPADRSVTCRDNEHRTVMAGDWRREERIIQSKARQTRALKLKDDSRPLPLLDDASCENQPELVGNATDFLRATQTYWTTST